MKILNPDKDAALERRVPRIYVQPQGWEDFNAFLQSPLVQEGMRSGQVTVATFKRRDANE